jgi:hypothetical protein
VKGRAEHHQLHFSHFFDNARVHTKKLAKKWGPRKKVLDVISELKKAADLAKVGRLRPVLLKN